MGSAGSIPLRTTVRMANIGRHATTADEGLTRLRAAGGRRRAAPSAAEVPIEIVERIGLHELGGRLRALGG